PAVMLVMELLCSLPRLSVFLFLPDTATAPIYTLSLHDALPIWADSTSTRLPTGWTACSRPSASTSPYATLSWTRSRIGGTPTRRDRKSTRLNSSHRTISYAVFCLKKKKHTKDHRHLTQTPCLLL